MVLSMVVSLVVVVCLRLRQRRTNSGVVLGEVVTGGVVLGVAI